MTQEKKILKNMHRNLHKLKKYNYSQLEALRAILTSFFKIFQLVSTLYQPVDLPGCLLQLYKLLLKPQVA